MQYKTLGDTGLLVSTLCFGTMTFHGGTGLFRAIGTVDQAGADQLIKASIEGGINFFDTADVYSEGESEKTLGQSLKNLNIPRHQVVIATKVYGRTGPGRLRRKEARCHRRHDHERADVVVVGDIRAQGEAGDLGVVPVDGKGDRRIAEHAEVEGIVGVFPDVVAAKHKILARCLLEAGMKLVAETGLKRSRGSRRTEKERRKHLIGASGTR